MDANEAARVILKAIEQVEDDGWHFSTGNTHFGGGCMNLWRGDEGVTIQGDSDTGDGPFAVEVR